MIRALYLFYVYRLSCSSMFRHISFQSRFLLFTRCTTIKPFLLRQPGPSWCPSSPAVVWPYRPRQRWLWPWNGLVVVVVVVVVLRLLVADLLEMKTMPGGRRQRRTMAGRCVQAAQAALADRVHHGMVMPPPLPLPPHVELQLVAVLVDAS